jgi:hypothetical protein
MLRSGREFANPDSEIVFCWAYGGIFQDPNPSAFQLWNRGMRMKISEINQCNPGCEPRKTKSSDGAASEFTRLLAEESEKVGETVSEVRSGMEPVALPSVLNFQPGAVQGNFSGEHREVELAVEGTINQLEKLQLALENPQEGLKTVAASIDDLSASAEKLQERATSLSADDPLRQMADELSVLVHVESIKYRRGDYL